MKKIKKLTNTGLAFILIFAVAGLMTSLQSQNIKGITGIVYDEQLNESLPFVHISLFDSTQTVMITGDVSDLDGKYQIKAESNFIGYLRFSAIGYETIWKQVKTDTYGNLNMDSLQLSFTAVDHEAIVVMGVLPVRVEPGRTSYYMNEEIIRSTITGSDVLRVIPGVELDFMQNLTIEGNKNIVILVDGQERDQSFISQLQPARIDRIDIINMPPIGYESEVSGAINIILHKDKSTGLSGHIHGEVPVSASETYLFPTAGLQYTMNRLNLYTSYSGDFRNFDLKESTVNRNLVNDINSEIRHIQYLNQLTRSNAVHFGADYSINERHRAGFYGSNQIFKQSLDGVSESNIPGGQEAWRLSDKSDMERHLTQHYSLSYRYQPSGDKKSELNVNAGYQNRTGSSSINYHDQVEGTIISSNQKPDEINIRLKVDYSYALRNNLNMDIGTLFRVRRIEDSMLPEFSYSDQNFSVYSSFHRFTDNTGVQGGVRLEKVDISLSEGLDRQSVKLFPAMSIYHRFEGTSHRLSLSYRSSVRYPHLYQINPNYFTDDILSGWKGNPTLKPSITRESGLEHTFQAGKHFLSSRLYANFSSNVIDLIATSAENNRIESVFMNTGRTGQFGVRFSGMIDAGPKSGLQPYVNVYMKKIYSDRDMIEMPVSKQAKFAFDSGLSANTTIGKGINLTLMFQYSTPVFEYQRSYFNGALYFINLDRSFRNGLTVGLTSALTLSKKFLYNGYEINSNEFYSRRVGHINMSAVPVWLRINYSFSKGFTKEKISHDLETSGGRSGRGF